MKENVKEVQSNLKKEILENNIEIVKDTSNLKSNLSEIDVLKPKTRKARVKKEIQNVEQEQINALNFENKIQKDNITTIQTHKELVRESKQYISTTNLDDDNMSLKEKFFAKREVVNSSTNEEPKQTVLKLQITKKIQEQKIGNIEFVKLVFFALSKRLMTTINSVMSPLSFFVDNFSILLKGISLLSMPMIFTMLVLNNLETVNTALSNSSIYMKLGYYTVFYFASVFVLIFGYSFIKGVYNMIKNTFKDLAKQEKQSSN